MMREKVERERCAVKEIRGIMPRERIGRGRNKIVGLITSSGCMKWEGETEGGWSVTCSNGSDCVSAMRLTVQH
jgi:hypothetical protein